MIYPRGKLRLEETTMTVTLTLNEITPDQAEQVLDLLRGVKAPDKVSEKTAKAERIEPDEFEDVPTAAEDLAEETEESHTIEEVRSALAKLGKAKGKEAAKAVLAKFGVTKVTDLKVGDYGAVLKEVG